ncbi:MAG TPA: prepilin-type N-terminal cleavage/methylation domain-containing protein [Sedimentisphaerales bacterium]|nr:prepilin-type N-terminal cleavage/methylation domain-containing protein [Sedimentisphaerales bacterium]HNU28081.1 prepilin-type N-terminal cleavage/methylation domain-containing protein [Sedimentisphaerales bacterium]
MQAKRGFTLVEILIVVVILGILAAIVIPQFTQASTEAKTNSLCSNLQTLRSQIELYKVQHNDKVPAAADFNTVMVYCTDIDGNVNGTGTKVRTDTFCYGPYLERIPENPFSNLATVGAVDDKTVAGGGTNGWDYVEATGEIYAGDSTEHAAY